VRSSENLCADEYDDDVFYLFLQKQKIDVSSVNLQLISNVCCLTRGQPIPLAIG